MRLGAPLHYHLLQLQGTMKQGAPLHYQLLQQLSARRTSPSPHLTTNTLHHHLISLERQAHLPITPHHHLTSAPLRARWTSPSVPAPRTSEVITVTWYGTMLVCAGGCGRAVGGTRLMGDAPGRPCGGHCQGWPP